MIKSQKKSLLIILSSILIATICIFSGCSFGKLSMKYISAEYESSISLFLINIENAGGKTLVANSFTVESYGEPVSASCIRIVTGYYNGSAMITRYRSYKPSNDENITIEFSLKKYQLDKPIVLKYNGEEI